MFSRRTHPARTWTVHTAPVNINMAMKLAACQAATHTRVPLDKCQGTLHSQRMWMAPGSKAKPLSNTFHITACKAGRKYPG